MQTLDVIKNQNILISPLDWGFGHTTRCVPIIKLLLKNENTIIFAGNNAQINFIKIEFPQIKTEYIEGYNIQLSSKKSTYTQLAKQGKSILNAIKNEINWVNNYIKTQTIDLIISDNRYGFRHKNIDSIFMAHQLNLCLPYLKTIVNSKLAKYINQFSCCWIYDDQNINLAGKLSQPKKIKIPYIYIGLHTRFFDKKISNIYDYLIVVSGPNPENIDFLNALEQKIKNSTLKIGIVSTVKSVNNFESIDYYYNPTTNKLNSLINASKCIVSRSGYTTLMDLFLRNKEAILIPTKGQYEQEYLGNYVKCSHFKFVSMSNLKF